MDLVPSTVTMNNGSRLWIISDDTSINKLTNPSTRIPDGMCRHKWLGCESDVTTIISPAPRRRYDQEWMAHRSLIKRMGESQLALLRLFLERSL